MQRPYRVVVAALGPDDAEHEAASLSRSLRDAGFEVVHVGACTSAPAVVATTVQEDADAVGVVLGGAAASPLLDEVVDGLAARDAEDVVLFGAGIAPGGEGSGPSASGPRCFAARSGPEVAAWLPGELDAREAPAP